MNILDQARELRQTWGVTLSLDEPLPGEDPGAAFGDMIAVEDRAFAQVEARHDLARLFPAIDCRARAILWLRVAEGWRLHELGAVFGRSRERIRQIEAQSLATLREAAVRQAVGPRR